MILFKKASQAEEYLRKKTLEGIRIGFIPTMGALHEGHLSLIKESKTDNEITVCSIFVNPFQFNNPDDLIKYPRPIENDIALLTTVDCDVLFLPSEKEIYPKGKADLHEFDLGFLDNTLEGASRPGHFNGVANVVARLLDIVQPYRTYFGQKDYQQVQVIHRMIESSDKDSMMVICPTVREADGVAMSSRNVRLTKNGRLKAQTISQTLFWVRDHFHQFSLEDLKHEAITKLESVGGIKIDYFEFRDAENFEPISSQTEGQNIVAVIAVIIDDVRLLDNILL